MEGGSWFRKSLRAEKERLLVASTVRKNTGYNTKWTRQGFRRPAKLPKM
jgi:hypothetical protein